MNAFNAGLPGLREERPHPAAKIDVRRQNDVLLVAERGKIHGVLHHAELEIFAHLLRNLNADSFLRFRCRAGDMRRQDHVVELHVRRVFERFDTEHIQRRAGNMAAA